MTFDELQANITDKLKELMIEREWSQNEVSRRTGIPQSHLSLILNSKMQWSLMELHKLCEGMGHTFNFFTRFKVRRL